jgi:MoaA/NifB/PqqE/SkfB family radical SAM enzyme
MNLHAMESRLKKIYAAEGRLLSLHVDVLYACDLDCTHCYLDDKRTRVMDTESIRQLLREARELGALKLTLSGGELFLRDDLFQIIEEARALRYFIRLKTHAGRITREDAHGHLPS